MIDAYEAALQRQARENDAKAAVLDKIRGQLNDGPTPIGRHWLDKELAEHRQRLNTQEHS